MNYPNTPSKPVTDHYHGIAVDDPYRWLEDAASPAVPDWTAAQNKLTRQVLDAIPQRAKIHARLKELYETATPDYLALQVRPGRTCALKRQPPLQQPLLASRFWPSQGFQPAAYRLARRVDPRIAWCI